MKVYVKNSEETSLFPNIISMIFLWIVSGIFFSISYFETKFTNPVANVIGFIPLILSFLVVADFKIKHTAVLVSKGYQEYNGKSITFMTFKTFKRKKNKDDMISTLYDCFTYGENNLEIDKYYNVYIGTVRHIITKVDETPLMDSSEDTDKTKIKYMQNEKNMIAGYILLIFSVILFFLYVYELIYKTIFQTYKIEHSDVTIVALVLLFIIYLYCVIKNYNMDNTITEEKTGTKKDTEYSRFVKKYKIEKADEVNIKFDVIRDFIQFTLLWLFIHFILFLLFFVPINAIFTFFPYILCVPFMVLIIQLVGLLFLINRDSRLLKKFRLKIDSAFDSTMIRHFEIIRATVNTIYDQYYIIEPNANVVLYNVKAYGFFTKKYYVYNKNDEIITVINRKPFSFTNKFVCRPVGQNPFIVRRKMSVYDDYSLYGLDDYIINGGIGAIENTIYNKNKELMGVVTAIESKNWYKLGNTDVNLMYTDNSIDLLLLSLCITIGNFSRKNNNN